MRQDIVSPPRHAPPRRKSSSVVPAAGCKALSPAHWAMHAGHSPAETRAGETGCMGVWDGRERGAQNAPEKRPPCCPPKKSVSVWGPASSLPLMSHTLSTCPRRTTEAGAEPWPHQAATSLGAQHACTCRQPAFAAQHMRSTVHPRSCREAGQAAALVTCSTRAAGPLRVLSWQWEAPARTMADTSMT